MLSATDMPVCRAMWRASDGVGFGNRKTYDQAKRVVDHGAPELVEAMDAGEISIQAAAVIAPEPPERQTQIVQMPRKLRRKVVREIREAAKLPAFSAASSVVRRPFNSGIYSRLAGPSRLMPAMAPASTPAACGFWPPKRGIVGAWG